MANKIKSRGREKEAVGSATEEDGAARDTAKGQYSHMVRGGNIVGGVGQKFVMGVEAGRGLKKNETG